jgi:hypothetical protein
MTQMSSELTVGVGPVRRRNDKARCSSRHAGSSRSNIAEQVSESNGALSGNKCIHRSFQDVSIAYDAAWMSEDSLKGQAAYK